MSNFNNIINFLKRHNCLYTTIGIVTFIVLMSGGWYIGVNYLDETSNFILCVVDYGVSLAVMSLLFIKDYDNSKK